MVINSSVSITYFLPLGIEIHPSRSMRGFFLGGACSVESPRQIKNRSPPRTRSTDKCPGTVTLFKFIKRCKNEKENAFYNKMIFFLVKISIFNEKLMFSIFTKHFYFLKCFCFYQADPYKYREIDADFYSQIYKFIQTKIA